MWASGPHNDHNDEDDIFHYVGHGPTITSSAAAAAAASSSPILGLLSQNCANHFFEYLIKIV